MLVTHPLEFEIPVCQAMGLVLLQATYDKLLSEVPKYKLITQSVLSDRLRVRSSIRYCAADLWSVLFVFFWSGKAALFPARRLQSVRVSAYLLVKVDCLHFADQWKPCTGGHTDS